MKTPVAFGMIVFNLDYYIEAVLESIYPYARQIFIVEGPVKYFVDKGYMISTDDTLSVIKAFPDPEGKIVLIQGQWPEKDEMFNAYADLVHPDIEHLWHVSADEVFKPEDIEAVLGMLPDYDSVGFCPVTFFGDFAHIVKGWAQDYERLRIQRWYEGARWQTSRPPSVINPESGKRWKKHRHLSGRDLAAQGIFFYHYTYVYPRQVMQKVQYYHDFLAAGRCIPNHYERVYKPWVLGTQRQRQVIENEFDGVHEYLPKYRGSYRTSLFTGRHPPAIAKRLDALRERLEKELCEIQCP